MEPGILRRQESWEGLNLGSDLPLEREFLEKRRNSLNKSKSLMNSANISYSSNITASIGL
ncbi:MAG TPA: hypothetical protein VF084_02380 [Nitrososphaeraceae archaeon]